MRTNGFLSRQQGYLMVIAVLLIMIIGFLGTAIVWMITSSTRSTTSLTQAQKAFYIANAGLEHATHLLETSTVANRSACSGLSISNTLGAGSYTVTGTGPYYVSSPTTLSSALTTSATSIPVASTANYQSSGRIMIEKELINYASTDSTHFLNATRGVDGSTAATHSSGTVIGQYQCALSSQGGVPSLSAPTNPGDPYGKRALLENVQLQEAWAVGNTLTSKYTLLRWNNPTETTWNNASATGSFNLADVKMLSYVDGWAVGASTTFLHWNGSSWAAVASGLAGTYNAIYCNASNDCHVVGTTRRFGHWNGSSWSSLTATGSVANTTLQAVNCDSSSDCWAAGSNAGGGKFYHGTGSPVAWVGINESSLTAFNTGSFFGIFCNSSSDCWAVGTGNTFAHYNGTSWSDYATSLPSVQYNYIFCNSSSDCWTVGNTSAGQDVFAHWDGSSWSRDSSNPTPAANLNAVACASSNDCWAVGANSVFVHWDGNSWTQFTTSGLPSTTLNGIAIVSPSTHPQSQWSEDFI